MEVRATLEERTSKAGNTYQVLVIKLTDTYEKLVFLDKPEIELLKMQVKNSNDVFPDFMNRN